MTARLLVFDLDGTLIDSTRDLATATNDALQRLAPDSAPIPRGTVQGFVGSGARVLMERSLRHAGVDRTVDEILPVFLECYESCLLDTTRLYPGIREVLEALSGHPKAVLTNKPGRLSRAILDGLGVGPFFSRVWGPDDVPDKKPHPAGLRKLMEELNSDEAHTWMIGDSPVDVRTARGASVRVAGVTWGLDPEGVRSEGPDRLVDDPRQLAELCSE